MADSPQDKEYKEKLSPLQYEVTQNKATERAFTGEYWNSFEDGTYVCICCGEKLFESDAKFEAMFGWPSFDKPMQEDHILEEVDTSFGMVRTEVMCKSCGAHLGHVFPDGPDTTGLRYCINSASLDLKAPD